MTVEAGLLYPNSTRRVVPFQATASSPQDSILEVDRFQLAQRVNGKYPAALDLRVNGEGINLILLETRIAIVGGPLPNRIELDRQRCTFPSEVEFIYDRPDNVSASATGRPQSITYSILDSGRVTNRGKMRVDVPLGLVLDSVRKGVKRVNVNVKGIRDRGFGGGISFRLPIVKIPDDLASAVPAGGCP